MNKLIIIYIVLLLVANRAHSFNGEGLYDACKATDTQSILVCKFYIQGVLDYAKKINADGNFLVKDFCIPKNVSDKQIIVNYLRDNPEKWNLYASYHISSALGNHYKCK